MDRTKLFQELVAQHEQHRGVTARHNPLAHVGSSTTTAGAFTRAAAEVSRDLHSTAAKVQQLTKSALFHTGLLGLLPSLSFFLREFCGHP